jgi:hypothetical protein
MRKICSSANTAPTSALIACAEARSWPSGFSSTMRLCGETRPASARLREIGPNRLGPVDM